MPSSHIYPHRSTAHSPSNLLDKIARGVVEAKGPIEWYMCARVELIELSRIRSKEERAQQIITDVYSDMGMGSPWGNYVCSPELHGKTFSMRHPLFRQTSMDFMNAAGLKENDVISCLLDRLQRTDRLKASPAYRPYCRHTPLSHRSSTLVPRAPQHSAPSCLRPGAIIQLNA